MTSPFLNLGVVAHVDAGKTSLTERLLLTAGALDELGSVDAGTTSTDSMTLERQRGITIRASVTSFELPGLVVNLLDTPGHPDFIAEVERSLTVLDAAVLVLSAVEGVQPQTVLIWRALQRLRVPTLLFVNKVDRAGADVDRVVAEVRHRLAPGAVALTAVRDPGTRSASVHCAPLDDQEVLAAVAEADDRVLARWVSGQRVAPRVVRCALRGGVRRGVLTPVLCGSAITGAGIGPLLDALATLMPRTEPAPGALAATAFAVDRDDRGRRVWLRVWSGELRPRQRLAFGDGPLEVITEVRLSAPRGLVAGVARAGQIAVIRGSGARIGDTVGEPPAQRRHRFAPPTRQALVTPADASQRSAMFAGLTELADEDPLIGLHLDEVDGEAAVRLHGEVQKEVIAALLADRHGVEVTFSESSPVCLERVRGTGEALDEILVGDNPYLATVGLRIEAAPVGSGVEFSPGIERGNLPPAFVAATEEGVRTGLRQGLRSWDVTDCLVTMTESGYWPRQSRPHQKFDKSMSSVAADFRCLSQVVLAAALARAGTVVCEPVDRFEVELPEASYGVVVAALGRLGAATLETEVRADGYTRIVGHLRSAVVSRLVAALPDLTGGEAVLMTRLDHHAPVVGASPARRRTGWDPHDRQTWFRHVLR